MARTKKTQAVVETYRAQERLTPIADTTGAIVNGRHPLLGE
jgi:hypothetical protein